MGSDLDSEPELTIAEEASSSQKTSDLSEQCEKSLLGPEEETTQRKKSTEVNANELIESKSIEEESHCAGPQPEVENVVPTKKYLTKDEKDDLTKELLKNIVSSLEPEEAKKLLQKASLLDKVEKVSLKELKHLLTMSDQDSSEIEEEVKSKIVSEKNAIKGPKGKGKGKQKTQK